MTFAISSEADRLKRMQRFNLETINEKPDEIKSNKVI